VERWAYFFRAAPTLLRVPEELAERPYAEALEVARTANLTEDEWTEYERAKMAEQDFRGGLSLAEKRGEERGERRGLQTAITTACELLGLPITAERQARLAQMGPAELEQLLGQLRQQRAWPGD
jgi:hypothetical protein